MSIEYKFINKIDSENIKNQIWEILCECDKEFIPFLSSRESSTQSKLDVLGSDQIKPVSYFNIMIAQNFILAFDNKVDKVVGFMTFKNNYYCEELESYSPSNYITTICVNKDYRNQGITKGFYRMMLTCLKDELKNPYITTRTWSTNASHIRILEQLNFKITKKLINHRGPNIDTVYYALGVD